MSRLSKKLNLSEPIGQKADSGASRGPAYSTCEPSPARLAALLAFLPLVFEGAGAHGRRTLDLGRNIPGLKGSPSFTHRHASMSDDSLKEMLKQRS